MAPVEGLDGTITTQQIHRRTVLSFYQIEHFTFPLGSVIASKKQDSA
jgi:hypothetical protein